MSGVLMTIFPILLIVSASGAGGALLGCLLFIPVYFEFRSGMRGWRIRYDLPPSYFRDIKSTNPITRQMAKESAEATLKEARDPNRRRYAFDKRKRK